jgi:hypothetical protein
MSRFEFTVTQKREMAARSSGVCEAGIFDTHEFYAMAKGDTCTRKAVEFDHIIPTGLVQEPIRSIDEGAHVCDAHHKVKTYTNDRPKIAKAKRIREALQGITLPKKKWQSKPFNQEKFDNTKTTTVRF